MQGIVNPQNCANVGDMTTRRTTTVSINTDLQTKLRRMTQLAGLELDRYITLSELIEALLVVGEAHRQEVFIHLHPTAASG